MSAIACLSWAYLRTKAAKQWGQGKAMNLGCRLQEWQIHLIMQVVRPSPATGRSSRRCT